MTNLIRRVSLLTLPALLLALPAGASAKTTSAKQYKNMAAVVNSAHSEWAALRGPAINKARAAGKQVSDKCLPAFVAAGKQELDPNQPLLQTGLFGLYLGYYAVENGASNELTASLRNQVAADAPAWQEWPGDTYRRGMDSWTSQNLSLNGFYMTPQELCDAATQWQGAGFKGSAMPPAISRVIAAGLSAQDSDLRRIKRLGSQLRKNGANASAVRRWRDGYIVENPSIVDEPAVKALSPDDVAQSGVASLVK